MATGKSSYNVSPNPGDVNTGVPTGTVVMWSVPTAPEGWLSCAGTAVSRITYSELFKVIGTTYGPGDGTTTFNLPNTNGRTIRGLGGSFTPIAFAGGNDTVTILPDNLPEHTHPITDPGHDHNFTAMTETFFVNEGIATDRAGNNGSLTTATATTGIIKTDKNITTNDVLNLTNSFLTLVFIIKY